MSSVDASRYNQFTPADLDTLVETAAPKMSPKRPDVRSLCEVPEPSPSALAYYARRQQALERTVDVCRSDIPWNDSRLADVLRNPKLNQDERHQIIQRLAREGGAQAFFGNETIRLYNGMNKEVSEDHRVIANNLQSALTSGAIDSKDLQRIADSPPDGAQRFLAVLRLGDNSLDAGSAARVLADALWARNGADGKDRAAAAMYFTSDPAVMARTLDTPARRATAFEALVDFNQSKPYGQWPPSVAEGWKNDALSAPARLFAAHPQELVDRYTALTSQQSPQPEVLARFFSQNIMNPEAKGIALDQQRELAPTVREALISTIDTYFNRARTGAKDSFQQVFAMEQLGRLVAGVSGAASLALTDYTQKVSSQDEARKEIAGLVGSVVGALAKRLQLPVGKAFEMSAKDATESILKMIQEQPDRPDAAFSTHLYREISKHGAGLREELNQPGLLRDFYGPRASDGRYLDEKLNVNPGGHAR